MTWRAHDLLWLERRWLRASTTASVPSWVSEGCGPVVVRRESVADTQMIAVGVRGNDRSQRFAAYAPIAQVTECMSPYDIAQMEAWLEHPLRDQMPVLQTLQQVAPLLNQYLLRWGVTGSLGYELVTGTSQIHVASDLDLVIDAPQYLSRAMAQSLCDTLRDVPCRVDVQIETPAGAIALQEWANNCPTVLLKAETGPVLVADPWYMKEAV